MMVGSQNAGKDSKDSGKKNEIKVQEVVTNMFSTMNSNDLASLKKYLDGGADGISDYTNAIEYSYSVTYVFPASDETSYITGVILSVDGMARS